MVDQVTAPLYDKLVAGFDQPGQSTGADGGLSSLRQDAFARFKEKGFPTTRDEEWKFTSLAPFLKDDFQLDAFADIDEEQLIAARDEARVPGLDAYLLVLYNGGIQRSISVLPENMGFTVQPLSSVLQEPVVQELLASGEISSNPMHALNTALFADGFFLEVPKNTVLDKPVQIIHLYSGASHFFVQPRHLVLINEFAKAELIESAMWLSSGHKLMINSVTQCSLKENAQLRQYNLQHHTEQERIVAVNQIHQERYSRYDNFTFNLPGAALIRNNLDVVLNGSMTETHLLGLYLVGADQLTDNHTSIHHKFPNCESNEVYKGVLLDNGKAVFNGKVFVERPAQKTNAFQQNNNLLLSNRAQVFAKPQLEIFADDVKCSHGCTVGQFDPESLFFLRARGISEESSRKLLVEAFMFDVTQKIDNDIIKEYVQSLIYAKMENAFASIV